MAALGFGFLPLSCADTLFCGAYIFTSFASRWYLDMLFAASQSSFFAHNCSPVQVIFWTPLMLEAILSGSFSAGLVQHTPSQDQHAEVCSC